MNNLKILRKKKKLTQEQVADILKVQKQTYQNYELGKREPNIQILQKLADHYSVTLDELIGRNFNQHRPKQEQELLQLFDQLDDLQKGRVLGYIENIVAENKQNKFYRRNING